MYFYPRARWWQMHIVNSNYRPFQPTVSHQGQKRFGLSVQEQAACQRLSGIVHSYLQVDANGPTPYPVIPDGTQAIFISPVGSKIGGALTQVRDIQIMQAGGYFGIRFYPAALRHFFKLDLSEITNQFAPSDYLPCTYFDDLHLRIYQTNHFEQRAQLCEQWLLSRFAPQSSRRIDDALSLVYQSLGNIRVSNLAKQLGVTTRHLNRLFSLHTGLNTKAFIQTIRIQQACRLGYDASLNVQDMIYKLGYVDQSHLIKDFNKHLKTNPSLFFQQLMSDFYNPAI